MNIFKLADFFNQKLSLAYVDVLGDITKIRQAARNLCQPNIKNLFLQAAEYEPTVEASLDAIDKISKNYYLTAKSYGLSAQQHAGFLKDLLENIHDLEGAVDGTVNTRIDPTALQKLSILKNKVQAIVPSMVIPPIKPQPKPQISSVTENKASGGSGNNEGDTKPASFTSSTTSDFDKRLDEINRGIQQREQERRDFINKQHEMSRQKEEELKKEREQAEAQQKEFEKKMGPDALMRAEQRLREVIPRNDGSDLIPAPSWEAQQRFNNSFNQ